MPSQTSVRDDRSFARRARRNHDELPGVTSIFATIVRVGRRNDIVDHAARGSGSPRAAPKKELGTGRAPAADKAFTVRAGGHELNRSVSPAPGNSDPGCSAEAQQTSAGSRGAQAAGELMSAPKSNTSVGINSSPPATPSEAAAVPMTGRGQHQRSTRGGGRVTSAGGWQAGTARRTRGRADRRAGRQGHDKRRSTETGCSILPGEPRAERLPSPSR